MVQHGQHYLNTADYTAKILAGISNLLSSHMTVLNYNFEQLTGFKIHRSMYIHEKVKKEIENSQICGIFPSEKKPCAFLVCSQ